MTDELDPRPTWLYRAFGPEGELLYVGISIDWRRRIWKQHRRWSQWFREMVAAEAWLLPNRLEALRAEAASIIVETPIFNTAYPLPRHCVPARDGFLRPPMGTPDEAWKRVRT